MRDHLLTAVQGLRPIADELGLSMGRFAVAWVLQNPNVAAAIVAPPVRHRSSVVAAGVSIPDELVRTHRRGVG
ncbi:MAG: hypothetical protein IPL43_13740 [Micropruina sp.]|nr:hypothetical protein [Micropruina sp.]